MPLPPLELLLETMTEEELEAFEGGLFPGP
jgi:hypothetical protein